MAEFTLVQDLVYTKLCMQKLNTSDSHVCNKRGNNATLVKEISTSEALTIRYYLAIMNFMAILPTLYSGSISDHFGRRKPMSVPFIASIFAQISFIVCSLFIEQNLFGLIYFSAFLSGISGATINITANAFGYISDITSVEKRTFRIIILEAMLYVGGFLGYNLAALLLEHVLEQRYEYGFLITLGIYIVTLIYIFAYLDESREESRDSTLRSVVDCKHIINVLKTVFRKRVASRRTKILLLLICSGISIMAISIQTSLLFAFLKNLNWKSSSYAYYSGYQFVVNGASLVVILPIACKLFPSYFTDTFIGMLGFFSKAAGLIVLGLANTTALVFMCPLFFIFNEYTMPSIRSMLSKLVDESERGKIFAFVASTQNLIQFLSNIIYAAIFAASVNFFPGLSFEIVAAFQIVAFCIFT
ncbi:proton-coupled folate transporter-like protein [Dinothrombium tinctorium]|uniref:Proton-coupled folate transporter-like protein n=1 Tax=Dinothrombium tinctorium TaxID=1965070 RepID=A0A3S3Q9Y9_9ACAR|nr:proton-coupled folate transporter-like protein [Dinothrombium tinctorium]